MYYIYLDGVRIEVSRAVYQDFYKYERKDRYFFKDLKFGRIRKDPKSGQEIYIPPQEVSWEEVSERERSLPGDENVEEQAIQAVLKERLRKALDTLTGEELIIRCFQSLRNSMRDWKRLRTVTMWLPRRSRWHGPLPRERFRSSA